MSRTHLSALQVAAWNALEMGPVWELRTRPKTATVGQESYAQDRFVADRDALSPTALMDSETLRATVQSCQLCSLCNARQQALFGSGTIPANSMWIGHAPSAEEDALGAVCAGMHGSLLDAMFSAIGLDRARDIFITNHLKCHAPREREPLPEQLQACSSYLERQITLVSPRVLVALGQFSAQTLLATQEPLESLRGRVHAHHCAGKIIPLIVTFHPEDLLRRQTEKAQAWRDLQLIKAALA